MSEIINILRNIQKIDMEIDSIGRKEKNYNDDMKNVGLAIEELGEQIQSLTGEVEEINAEKKEREEKIRESNEKIEKDKARLSEIKNDKQLKALNKGISSSEKTVKQLEYELVGISQRLQEKTDEAEAKSTELQEKTDRLDSLTTELQEKSVAWEKSLEQMNENRLEIAATLKPIVLKRYETIKSKRAGIGIINVDKETCQGCYIQIPPQVYNQLIKGTEELMTCPHCHRILFFDNSTAEQKTTTAEETA